MRRYVELTASQLDAVAAALGEEAVFALRMVEPPFEGSDPNGWLAGYQDGRHMGWMLAASMLATRAAHAAHAAEQLRQVRRDVRKLERAS